MKKQVISGAVFLLLISGLVIHLKPGRAESIPENEFKTAKSLYYSDIDGSFEKYNQLVAKASDNDRVRFDMVHILLEKGDYQEAVANLKLLLKHNPGEERYRLAMIKTTYLAGMPAETVNYSANAGLTPEEMYWRGLALKDLEKNDEAKEILLKSLNTKPYNPQAYYWLGVLSQKAADYENAIFFYRKAASQDSNLTAVYMPLAQCCEATGKLSLAYSYLNHARAAYPWDLDIKAALEKFRNDHPNFWKQQEINDQREREQKIPPRVTAIKKNRQNIPELRIGLAERVKLLQLKAGGSFRLSNQYTSRHFKIASNIRLTVKQRGSRIEVWSERGNLLFRTSHSVYLTYDNPESTTIIFDIKNGNGRLLSGHGDRIYRGKMQFIPKSNGLTLVNRLNMEEYLYGVVPGEMESTWPAAALEAQAIAARTYAISHRGYFKSRGFDLLPTVASQVYGGVRIEKQTTNAAVDATAGKIIVYNGKTISAFYTGNNGGYSASAEDIWGADIPYLQAVPDRSLTMDSQLLSPTELAEWLTNPPSTYSSNPQYSARCHYRWTAWIPRTEIEHRLGKSDKIGNIISITIVNRSEAGVVTEVSVKGTNGECTLTGDAIRSKLGRLRSNMFIVAPKLKAGGLVEYFIFNGGGWGHGVGMCQSGAAGMAADGYKVEEILNHYYRGTELKELY